MFRAETLQAFGLGWAFSLVLTSAAPVGAAELWIGGGTCRTIWPDSEMRINDNAISYIGPFAGTHRVIDCPVVSNTYVKMWNATTTHLTGNCGFSSSIKNTTARVCRKNWDTWTSFVCSNGITTTCTQVDQAYDLTFTGAFLSPWTVDGGHGYPYVQVEMPPSSTVTGIYVVTTN